MSRTFSSKAAAVRLPNPIGGEIPITTNIQNKDKTQQIVIIVSRNLYDSRKVGKSGNLDYLLENQGNK